MYVKTDWFLLGSGIIFIMCFINYSVLHNIEYQVIINILITIVEMFI